MTVPDTTRSPVPEGPYDLVVVGGGINGTAIVRDAVLRGHSTALLEKGDLASGTSGNSSKMIHGGIRYLEQLKLGQVYECLRERFLLCRLAPHLVRPQSFLLPVYEGSSRGPRWVRLGLFLYDLLAWGRRLGRSSFLSREEVLERAPDLLAEGLLGGGLYHDAVMDDARLCLLNAVAAREEARARSVPCVIRNYAEVVERRSTSPIRITVEDRVSGVRQEILCHHLVRAVGPWTDPELLLPSKGVHVVLPPFPIADGLLLTHSKDGRVFFLVPWKGLSVVGTTETPFDGRPDGLTVQPEEVDYLLSELNRVFPRLQLGRREIRGVFAGVRPLARRRGWLELFGHRTRVGGLSRKHRVVDDGHGTLTVFGGKYTNYRAVAKQVVNRIFGSGGCETHLRPLPGGESGGWSSFRAHLPADDLARAGEEQVGRLFRRYGSRCRDVLGLGTDDPSLLEPIIPGLPEIRAEVVHGIRNEFVVYPEDFLCRRTSMRYATGLGKAAYDAVEELIRRHARPSPPDLEGARERFLADCEREAALRESELKEHSSGDAAGTR